MIEGLINRPPKTVRSNGNSETKEFKNFAWIKSSPFSLFIFFVGLAQWLWHIHRGVSAIMITGVIVGAFLFWVTTIISMVDVRAPFRTPASRSLPIYLLFVQQTATVFLAPILPSKIKALYTKLRENIISKKSAVIEWYHNRHSNPSSFALCHLSNITHFSALLKLTLADVKQAPARIYARLPSLEKSKEAFKYLYDGMFCKIPFEEREKVAVNSLDHLRRNTLLWLSKSLSVVPHQRNSFLILIQAFLDLPYEQLLDDRVNEAPWNAIFTILCHSYFNKSSRSDFDDKEIEDITFLLRGLAFIGHGVCNSAEFRRLYEALYIDAKDLTRMLANLAYWKHIIDDTSTRQTTVAESIQYAVEFANEWPTDIITNMLVCVKSDVRRFQLEKYRIFSPFYEYLSVNPRSLASHKLIPSKILDSVLDIAAIVLAKELPPQSDPVISFIASMEHHIKDPLDHATDVHSAFAAVIHTLSARLRQSPGYGELEPLFFRLTSLARSPLWRDVFPRAIAHILLALAHTPRYIWGETRDSVVKLLALIIPDPFEFDGKDWDTWWVNMMVGFGKLADQFQDDGTNDLVLDAILQNSVIALDNGAQFYSEEIAPETLDKLKGIKGHHVRFIASRVFRIPELALSTLPLPESLDQDMVWHNLLSFYCEELGSMFSKPNLPFLREITLTGCHGL